MIITNNLSSHSAKDERGRWGRPTEMSRDPGAARPTEEAAAEGGAAARTCEQEAGDRHGVQLLGGGDVVAVQEVVQQVDGQVPGRGAELAVAAEQGQDVDKEPAALQERGVGPEGRQLQLLEQAEQKRVRAASREPRCPRKGRGRSPPAGW